MSDSSRKRPPGRESFLHFHAIGTRWQDNDAYGHVNNAVYYEYFDTAVNAFLMHAAGRDIRQLEQLGIVAETGCRYHSSISFPQNLEIGLAVERLGKSSITYRIGVFAAGASHAAALGKFVHVYVDAASREVSAIPTCIRDAVTPLVVTDSLWH